MMRGLFEGHDGLAHTAPTPTFFSHAFDIVHQRALRPQKRAAPYTACDTSCFRNLPIFR